MTACAPKSRNQVIEATRIDDTSLLQRVSASAHPYVLVNFFATYCKPCEKEIPDLARMAADPAKQVDILFVALDEKATIDQDIGAMFDRMKITFPVLHYTLSDAEAFIHEMYPEWQGDIPLNMVFRNDGTMIKGMGMTDPQEVTMVIHHDQSFRE